jgi:sulfate adenylyltransferase
MDCDLNKTDLLNLVNIRLGIYKPLNNLCSENTYRSILNKRKINGKFYPLPFNLTSKERPKLNEKLDFYYKKKKFASIKTPSIFKPNLKEHNKIIFSTNDKKHIGVKLNLIKKNQFFIGGSYKLFNTKYLKKIFHINYNLVGSLRKFKQKKNFIIFSTRNIIHGGHELIINKLLDRNKKILIFILINEKFKFKKKLLKNFFKKFINQNKYKKKIFFKFIEIPTFYAGPLEAAFQAKIFENLGFDYFYIGRDHAGFKNFYDIFASQKFVKKQNLKIKILNFNEPMYCNICKKSVFNKFKKKVECTICGNKKLEQISGTKIRRLLKNKNDSLYRFISKKYLSFIKIL